MAVPQFFLAWVDSTETTFGVQHQVYDPATGLYTIQLDHKEGDFAVLTLNLKNPRIGLLNAGRKVFVWLSWRDSEGVVHPIFFGRLVAIPDGIFRNIVTLTFVAKPTDYFEQRKAIADALKSDPDYYDPVFIDPNLWDDPDTILETYTARWHISRGQDGGPLIVTASEMIVGEDGTEVFEETDVFNDTVDLRFDGAPLPAISIKGSVHWKQTNAAPAFTIPIPLPAIGSFTSGIYDSWPKAGASLGGGWSAGPDTFCVDLNNARDAKTANAHYTWHNRAKHHEVGDCMSANHSITYLLGPIGWAQKLTEHLQPGLIWQGGGYGTVTTSWHTVLEDPDTEDPDINIPFHYDCTWKGVVYWVVQPILSIAPGGSTLERKENLTFTMIADVQAIMTEPDELPTTPEKPQEIQGADVGVPIVGEGGTVIESAPPIGNTNQPYYFCTERGLRSTRYLLLRGRAALRAGARCAIGTWGFSWERGLQLTLRKNATLNHHNMPGGTVSGKIISYQLKANVETGKKSASLEIGATVGHDGTVESQNLTGNDYIEDDYIEDGYYGNTTSQETLGDLGYSIPIQPTGQEVTPNLTYNDVVVSVQVLGGTVEQQLAALNGQGPQFYQPIYNMSIEEKQRVMAAAEQAEQTWLQNLARYIRIELKPIEGSGSENEFNLTLTSLKIQKTIDLEAASNL